MRILSDLFSNGFAERVNISDNEIKAILFIHFPYKFSTFFIFMNIKKLHI